MIVTRCTLELRAYGREGDSCVILSLVVRGSDGRIAVPPMLCPLHRGPYLPAEGRYDELPATEMLAVGPCLLDLRTLLADARPASAGEGGAG